MIGHPEILAPAGNEESLVAALNCGADAVYLGVSRFSARAYAKNFSLEQLKEKIIYCHDRNVKVHVALNTLLFGDAELVEAANTAYELAKMDVDAFIIQDLSLAEVVRNIAPHIPMHASTQLSLTDVSGALLMKDLGFSRIVVGREVSKKELSEIIAVGIDTEVFIHGALCMSVSGQCYISAAMGGRSGNRGRCAGACRLPFENNCLSLKDLSLISHSRELSDMGVCSFKIEGRMRRPEYVAAVVTALSKSLSSEQYDTELLSSSFSRNGLTDGYFTSKLGSDMFGIRLKEDVDSMTSSLPVLKPLCFVPTRFIPVTMDVYVKRDAPMKLCVSTPDFHYTAYGDIPQSAKTKELTQDDILSSISKTGDTPYIIESVTQDVDGGLFVSKSSLNSLRRDALDGLSALRCARISSASPPSLAPLPQTRAHRKQQLVAMVENEDQLKSIDVSKFLLVGVPVHMAEKIQPEKNIAVVLPRALFGLESSLKLRLKDIFSRGIKTAVCSTLGAVKAAQDIGFSVFGDFSLNATSERSINILHRMGVDYITASAECDLPHLGKGIDAGATVGYVGYGCIPLMVTRNCPAKQTSHYRGCTKKGCYIIDRKGISFPVMCDDNVSYVLNPNPIWLGDKSSEYENFDYALLRFTTESGSRVSDIVASFSAHRSVDFEYTRGLFRGISKWEKSEDKIKSKED